MPSFSIIIPFKTGKKYLLECLKSVLDQTFPNYEVIILADITSNSDGALDAIMTLNHSKIKIIASENNLNILENWNRIKDLERMEYMTILGYDDILHPDFLKGIANLINKEPNASLFHTHFNYIDSDGNIIKPCSPLPSQLTASQYLSLSLQDKLSVMATGYVFKSADYNLVSGICIEYPNLIYADLQLWIDLTKRSYLAISEGFFFSFRIHQSTTKTSKDKILLDAFLVYLKYLGTLEKEQASFAIVLQNYLPKYILDTTQSLAHRLLRTEKKYRDGFSMQALFNKMKNGAEAMGISINPMSRPSIKWASRIDSNPILLSLFQLFKRVYKKPIY